MLASLDLIEPEIPESRKGLRKVGDYKNFKAPTAPTAKEESLVVPEIPELRKGLRKVKDYKAFKHGPAPAPPGGDPNAAGPVSRATVS